MAFVTDLMDRSKLARAGEVAIGRDASDAEGADVVVVDLGAHADVIPAARLLAPSARIVAFGRHTDVDVLRKALDDGADESLPRSKFFADVAGSILPGAAPDQKTGDQTTDDQTRGQG